MGSHLGPTTTDVYLSKIEQKSLIICWNSRHAAKILVLSDENHLNLFSSTLDSIDSKVSVSHEENEDNRLLCSVILLTRRSD